MGWGGARVGAGAKPKNKPGKVVGMDGKPRADVLPPSMQTTAAADPPAPAEGLATPPADLSERRKAFWIEWAPRAIAAGTLIDATVLGFRELSEQYVIKCDLAKAVDDKAPGYVESLKLWAKVTQRVDASMARFKLTAFGKPESTKHQKTAANPWAAVAAPGKS